MKSLRKISTDPSFWSLILMNVIFIHFFSAHQNSFKTYLWIYWLQSVLIGISNFFNLLTIREIVPENLKINNEPVKAKKSANGCVAFFFLIHYGTFHLVYMVFLATDFNSLGRLDMTLFKYGAMAVLLNQIIWFIQTKLKQKHQPVNPGKSFLFPYLRIIPMHLTIILPAIFNISSVYLFLILKTIMDVAMHLITTDWYWQKQEHTIGDFAHTDML